MAIVEVQGWLSVCEANRTAFNNVNPEYPEPPSLPIRLATEWLALKTENERLKARDGNATINLCYDDGDNPFAEEQLQHLDFGVADNVYAVESVNSKKMQGENERLKAFSAKVEWSDVRVGPGSGTMGSGGDGTRVPACPLCRGVKPGDGDGVFIDEAIGHKEGCLFTMVDIATKGDP